MKAEQLLSTAPPKSISAWAIPAIQGLGVVNPGRAIPNYEAFAVKVRSALMTDGNTRFRPMVRNTLAFLMQHGPFSLDPTLILHAACKIGACEALGSVAMQQLNLMHEQERTAS